MSREPYLEHCPECAQVVRCRPLHVHPTNQGGVLATYRCRVCHYGWRTSWQREPDMEMSH